MEVKFLYEANLHMTYLHLGYFMERENPVLLLNIYILGIFTEKPYSKPLERNVVYIPITTSSHTTSMTSK